MAIPKFSELEEQILKDWNDKQIFKKTLARPSPKGNFVFYDGPPTANGIPHIGHVETRAFKDIIPRFKTMQGYHVERKAGWDTQGLPVELEVEKDLKISGKKAIEEYGIEKFNAQAKESVWKYKDLWEKMTERVGFWLDTEHPYITYEPDYIETLWWIYKQAWDQDLLKQDYKVVPYCPRDGTSLSSHEVAQGYQNVEDTSVYVKFELVDEPSTFVLAWTTTPWTLPGNVALAVDEKIEYAKVKVGNEILIVASALIEKVVGETEILEKIDGKALVGKKYKPLFDFLDLAKESGKKAYYITDADFVTTADGTGVVHTAVMYGEDDFNLGQKLDLPKMHTVDGQGKFNELVKPWVGWKVKAIDAAVENKTTDAIIQYLEDNGKLYKVEKYKHDYPFCWRCKSPLLYYAKTSWFILMSKLRDQLIKNNEQVNWYPKHIKDGRFGEWLREVKDWAISRERYWGTPLPIWQCTECKHQQCFGSYADVAKHIQSKNRYLLVRHGESTNNLTKTLDTVLEDGTADLTETGLQQAQSAAKALKAKKVTRIFSSQFARAKQTADVIAKELGLSVETDMGVNEYRIGPRYEGKTIAEFHEKFGHRADRLHEAPEGGETWLQIQQRMIHFLKECERKFKGETILIVSHADPIMVAEWTMSFEPESAIGTSDYPKNGQVRELQFPAAMFTEEGIFDPHRPYSDTWSWPCMQCNKGTMNRIPEVGDAWFDSGAMPFAQYHYPFENKKLIDSGDTYPANYISEAIDQTRGWFYTLLAISTILQKAKVVKKPSYENVVVLGHLNDARGRKLSKSLKNYGDINELMDTHGADALRWFMYTANQPWDPKNFDTKIVDEGVKKTFLILMNVVSFWQLTSPNPSSERRGAPSPESATHPLDRWIHSLVNVLTQDVTERLERYDITGAARAIGAFVTDLSTWYVRRSRDRLKGEEAPMASAMLQHVLLKLSKLMAPFTPFLAENVYTTVGGQLESVHLEDWPKVGEIDQRLVQEMADLRLIIEQAHAIRAKHGIKVRQPLGQAVVRQTLRHGFDEILKDELNIKELIDNAPLTSGTVSKDHKMAETEHPLIALDITITDELKEEGLLRDLVREFNALRKLAKLHPSDEIIAHVEAQSLAAQVIERYAQKFLREVRAKAVTPSLDGAASTQTIQLDDTSVTIGLVKV